MVLTDPGFVVTEAVEVFDQLEVAVDRERRILMEGMERCQEDAEAHSGIRPSGDLMVKPGSARR